MKEEYELGKPHKHGTKENITHLTGKHSKAKSEALKKRLVMEKEIRHRAPSLMREFKKERRDKLRKEE